MSRRNRRNVVRASVLLDLAEQGCLSRRQTAAALMLERDRELAEKGRQPASSGFDPPIAGPRSRGCEIIASQSWERAKQALPGFYRRLLGELERINTGPGRKGSLAALPIRTGLADARDDTLVKRGIIAGMLEIAADHYGVPLEA